MKSIFLYQICLSINFRRFPISKLFETNVNPRHRLEISINLASGSGFCLDQLLVKYNQKVKSLLKSLSWWDFMFCRYFGVCPAPGGSFCQAKFSGARPRRGLQPGKSFWLRPRRGLRPGKVLLHPADGALPTDNCFDPTPGWAKGPTLYPGIHDWM